MYVTLNGGVKLSDEPKNRGSFPFVARAFHAVLFTLGIPCEKNYDTWSSSFRVAAFSENALLKLKEALGVDYLLLVADEVAKAPNAIKALSDVCALGDGSVDFPITVMASCYVPEIAARAFTNSGRSLVAIPTVLAPCASQFRS